MIDDKKLTVFLGGTTTSNWRKQFLDTVDKDKFDCFNPIVEEWNEDAKENERKHRENDNIILYVLSPKMKGFYSIAEMIDDSNKRPNNTICVFLKQDEDAIFDDTQWNSILEIEKMCKRNKTWTDHSILYVASTLEYIAKELLKRNGK